MQLTAFRAIESFTKLLSRTLPSLQGVVILNYMTYIKEIDRMSYPARNDTVKLPVMKPPQTDSLCTYIIHFLLSPVHRLRRHLGGYNALTLTQPYLKLVNMMRLFS